MKRRGFTLIEVVVAILVGSIVIGTGMVMYLQGNKYFYKTTEHSSFRTEALVILERIGEDLDQLQVSTDRNPQTGNYFLTEPYIFLDPFDLELKDDNGNVIETVRAGKGIRFWRFHHLEMGPPLEGVPNGKPKLVAHKLEYRLKPIDSGDLSKGYNLERNGKVVNKQPLEDCFFHQEPMIVAANQVQGSRHAILSVVVVPKGGAFGNMDINTIRRLQAEDAIVTRTFHLIGYESFYTSVLYSAMQSRQGAGGSVEGLDQLEAAVLAHAQAETPGNLFTTLSNNVRSEAPPTHLVPPEAFYLDVNAEFDDSSANTDPGWMAAPRTPGRPAGAGEFTFEDNGAGPGSGSGSGSASSASGSGSGSG